MLRIKEVEMVESVDDLEGQSRGTEEPERGLVLSRKTYRLHDLRLLSSHWSS